jgi:hypothetical protein
MNSKRYMIFHLVAQVLLKMKYIKAGFVSREVIKMLGLKNRINWFDRWLTAVTFAEAGEPQTALEMRDRRPAQKKRRRKVNQPRDHHHDRPVLRA